MCLLVISISKNLGSLEFRHEDSRNYNHVTIAWNTVTIDMNTVSDDRVGEMNEKRRRREKSGILGVFPAFP